MSELSLRQLRVYAFMTQYARTENDILAGLVPFFEPILTEMEGTLFSPEQFSRRVQEIYGWSFTSDIAEEFIPRLEHFEWLEKKIDNTKENAYLVQKPNGQTESDYQKVDKKLEEIGRQFQEFANRVSPLFARNKEIAYFEELILNWLVNVGGEDRAAIRKAAYDWVKQDWETVGGGALDTKYFNKLSNEESYISARFVQNLHLEKLTNFEFLVDISAAAMLTDIVLDFQKPEASKGSNRSLNVVLDGPVLMDLLGLSGINAKRNIQKIFQEVQKIGGKTITFDHCCGEATDNLRAVLELPPNRRYGPTADALRRQELMPEYAVSVSKDIEYFVRQAGVDIVYQKLDEFPNQHRYFPADMYEDCMHRIRWHDESRPRERDAKSIGLVMRRRQDRRTSDPLDTGYILVSKNRILAEFSSRFCREHGLIKNNQVGPVIHQRRFATALWLAVGSLDDQEVPRRQVLSACEYVARSQQTVIREAQSLMRQVRPEHADQLDALLSKPRSTQILMDYTASSDRVLDENNIEEIFEAMRRSTAEDVQREADKRLDQIKESEREKQEELDRQLREMKKEREEAIEKAKDIELKEKQTLQNIVEKTKSFERRMRVIERFSLFVIILIVSGTGFPIGSVLGFEFASYVWGVVCFLGGLFLLFRQKDGRFPHIFEDLIQKRRAKYVEDKVSDIGRSDLLESYEIDWEKGEVVSDKEVLE